MNVIRLLRGSSCCIAGELHTSLCLLLLFATCLIGQAPVPAWSNLVTGSVSYSVSGRKAWTVSREVEPAALTEVWVEAQDGSHIRLGIFPGGLGWMGWSPDGRKVLYRDGPLESNLFSTSEPRIEGIVSASMWEIQADGGGMRRLRDTKTLVRSGLWARSSGNGNGYHSDLGNVLGDLQEALRISSLAYGALHQWDFRLAKGLYRQAAHQFEELSGDFGELGLHSEPVLDYAKELARRSTEAGKDGSRWVCREHLASIGDLLDSYESQHEGQSPESLETLRAWAAGNDPDETTVRYLTRLFRAPEDPVADRISYFYSSFSPIGGAVATSPFYKGRLVELIRTHDGFTVVDRAVGQAQIDSLMKVGEKLLDSGEAPAVPSLEVVTRMAPKFALGFCKLGYAYLQGKNLDSATKAFERAVVLNHKLAEAYNGLGLVYQQLPKARYTAIHYFQKALQHNRTYVEARYNMALLRQALEEHDVIHDVERILQIDPEFAPAYKLLGEWHEVYEEDFEQAAIHYAHYVSLVPEDPEGQRLLANVYLRAKDYHRIVELLTEYIDEHPEEVPVLSVLAQACVKLRRLEWARRYFDDFLAGTNKTEKSYYQDPWSLMSKDEVAAYEALDSGEREDFLTKFWLDRDPDLTTATNERQLEHYRRVWFARQNFSKGKTPWDRRGEVYIRFGEPDFRTTSSMRNFDQSMKVQRVRERIARDLYGTASTEMSFMGGPVYAVKSLKGNIGGGVNLGEGFGDDRQVAQGGGRLAETATQRTSGDADEAQIEGVRLNSGLGADMKFTAESLELMRTENVVMDSRGALGDISGSASANQFNAKAVTAQEDASMVPWETWVYVDVKGGIEITFTDERMMGNFDYAPPPIDGNLPIQQMARFNQHNPRRVVELAAMVTPDYYKPPPQALPLEFYYDLAHFKGKMLDPAILEVYLGVPHKIGKYHADRDLTDMVVERSVAVHNARTGAVYRRQGDLLFRSNGDLTTLHGGFVPDLVGLGVAPGAYRLEVQIRDRLSGRQGRYRQQIVVDDYDEEKLQLSELQLAHRIGESEEPGTFTKGDLQVIPIPTRTFGQDQSVFVYYEIYHLERDDFGQTRYKVEYTIGPKGLSGRKASGIISQLVKVLTSKKKQFAVGYEQLGIDDSEVAYMELDMEAAGTGNYYLKVNVTDLNGGAKVSREVGFSVLK